MAGVDAKQYIGYFFGPKLFNNRTGKRISTKANQVLHLSLRFEIKLRLSSFKLIQQGKFY